MIMLIISEILSVHSKGSKVNCRFLEIVLSDGIAHAFPHLASVKNPRKNE